MKKKYKKIDNQIQVNYISLTYIDIHYSTDITRVLKTLSFSIKRPKWSYYSLTNDN